MSAVTTVSATTASAAALSSSSTFALVLISWLVLLLRLLLRLWSLCNDGLSISCAMARAMNAVVNGNFKPMQRTPAECLEL